ncbi:hypothetical protein [Alicyclobacillus vulcanalis]|nr:hypothetical protein [Alicyclobacillus vulcanalis]
MQILLMGATTSRKFDMKMKKPARPKVENTSTFESRRFFVNERR